MKILLTEKDNSEIRGDLVPFIIQRTDLTPIPSTLECLIRVNEELAPFIEQGKVIALGDKDIQYRIIYAMRQADGIVHQGDHRFTLTKIIAVLERTHKLAYLTEKAIIKENTTLGALFRVCGAEMAVSSDVAVDKFTCLIGEYPTHSLMRAMGRTATTIVWDGKTSVAFKRVKDLFNEPPSEILPQDVTQAIESGFLERHEQPAFYSNKADGSIAKSSAKHIRRSSYEMFADEQTLNNLSTHLVNRKIWTTRFMPTLNAGDVIEIAGEKWIIITATHVFGKSGSGSGSQMSRFWLGGLSVV